MNITLGELSDKVVALSWKRIAKYVAILYVAHAVVGMGIGLYLGAMHPVEALQFVERMTN